MGIKKSNELSLNPKTKPVGRWLWAYRIEKGKNYVISSVFLTKKEAKKYFGPTEHICLDWSFQEFQK